MSSARRIGRAPGAAIALASMFTLATIAGCATSSEGFPDFTAPVVDAVDAVDDTVESAVSNELEQFRLASGPQIAVAVIDSTGDSSIEDYSIDLARRWQVGDAERDDGVVVVIALDDRRMRIEVGSGVEGDLTDVAAGRIVDAVMLPLLRVDDVDGAVREGTQAIMAVWRGEALPTPSTPSNNNEGDVADVATWFIFFVFLMFIGAGITIFVLVLGSRRITWTTNGPHYGTGGIYGSGGFRGGGGFGGGGFSGGFGGGFSGGGAGGSW